MAAIVIYRVLTGIPESGDHIAYSGKARCAGMVPADGDIEWGPVECAVDASAATINAAIKNSAITCAFEQREVVVGDFDKKTLIGGASDL